MYLYDRNMVTNTNLKYANSSSNYYVIIMLQNLKKKSHFLRIPEARSAERPSKRSALVLYKVPWYSTNESILYKVPWCSNNENI